MFKVVNEVYKFWKIWLVNDRVEFMLCVLVIICCWKVEIVVIMVYEVGKLWDEVVGDVVEGIDFIEYYVCLMMDLV